jgi:uncharacterized protein YkwD
MLFILKLLLPVMLLLGSPDLNWISNNVLNNNFSTSEPMNASAGLSLNEYFIEKDETTEALEKLMVPWLLYYTNQYRTDQGLDTLKYDPCLVTAARYHTDYLYNESKEKQVFKLVHMEDPASKWFKGKGPSDRALKAGCKKTCGENALYFTRSGLPASEFANHKKLSETAKLLARDMVYEQWHKSKAHRENMLKKDYSSLGVSVAIGKQSAEDVPAHLSMAVNLVVFGVQVMAY